MDQTIPGLTQAGAPSYFVDLIIFIALLGGYGFMALKRYWLPKLRPAPAVHHRSWWQRLFARTTAGSRTLSADEWQSIRSCRRVFLPVVFAYAVLLGFLSSSYGLVAMLWIWLATVAGMLVRYQSDKRLGQNGPH